MAIVDPERLAPIVSRKRSKTLRMDRIPSREWERLRREYKRNERFRKRKPTTRAQCIKRGLGTPEKPCAYVSCAYNLYLDVARNGNIVVNWPGKQPWEIPQTCALHVAEMMADGKHGDPDTQFVTIAKLLNMSRERARQLEGIILEKVRSAVTPQMRDLAQNDGPEVWETTQRRAG